MQTSETAKLCYGIGPSVIHFPAEADRVVGLPGRGAPCHHDRRLHPCSASNSGQKPEQSGSRKPKNTGSAWSLSGWDQRHLDLRPC